VGWNCGVVEVSVWQGAPGGLIKPEVPGVKIKYEDN
jgi:hypothetical protein